MTVKKIKFSIPGLPISINHTYSRRGKFIFIRASAKEYLKKIRKIVKKVVKIKTILCQPIRMGIIYYFPDLRRRDVHNYHHLIANGLENIIYEDDKWITDMSLKKRIDRADPRTEVTIWVKD